MLRLAGLALLLVTAPVQSTDEDRAPVKRVEVDAMPYYRYIGIGQAIVIHVGEPFDTMLGSERQADILAARDRVVAEPAFVTPMTMMALSARLYDVGLRDDAVFWHYVAKARYITLKRVIVTDGGFGSPFSPVNAAMSSFVDLAGPTINGYAFCDVAKQVATLKAANDWVEAHPYQALFEPSLSARAGDRAENLKAAIAEIRGWAEDERLQLSDPATLKALAVESQKHHMRERFCW